MCADSIKSFLLPTLSTSGSAFSSISLPYSSPFSRELEWDGIRSALLFCRGCSVWVATITQGGGKTTWRDEKKRKKRKRSGGEGGNVCLEFTQRVHCVFRSVTVSFSELSGVFSGSEQSQAFLCRQETQVLHFISSVIAEDEWRPLEDSSQVCRQWLSFGPLWPPFHLHTDTYRCRATLQANTPPQNRGRCAQTFTSTQLNISGINNRTV